MTTRLDEAVRPSRRRPLWQFALFLGCAAVVGKNACAHIFCTTERSSIVGPAPLAQGDDDRDGLVDAEEDALAERFAPIVVLHHLDVNLPASAPWLFARADVFGSGTTTALAGAALGARGDGPRFSEEAQRGSRDPRDWTTYVHVFPRADGGVNVQYWFFYPFSNGPLFFDHDTDWEHLTVQLDAEGHPIAAHLAQHANDHPGRFHAWTALRKLDEHVIVYSARGTHATYATREEAAWFEDTPECTNVHACRDVVWKTWQGGGLENLGERSNPRTSDRAFSVGQRWGNAGLIPGTSAPVGPLYHRGFCVDGVRGCLDDVPAPGSRVSSITVRGDTGS